MYLFAAIINKKDFDKATTSQMLDHIEKFGGYEIGTWGLVQYGDLFRIGGKKFLKHPIKIEKEIHINWIFSKAGKKKMFNALKNKKRKKDSKGTFGYLVPQKKEDSFSKCLLKKKWYHYLTKMMKNDDTLLFINA